MSRINTNIAALRAVRQSGINHRDLNLRLERLASGLRINRGQDDPAGLIVSERLRFEIRGTKQAIENSIRASNVIATTEGALAEVSSLLLDVQALVVQAANEAGLTEAEVDANQLAIDSILTSIDRIANTATFGGQKLLNGEKEYILSAVPLAAIGSVSVFAARLPQNSHRDISVRVTQSAQTAQIQLIGTNGSGVSTLSATTIEVRGPLGTDQFSFASGTTLAEVQTAINGATAAIGVAATVSAAAGMASALMINTTSFGSAAFVTVTPLDGNFVEAGNNGSMIRAVGVDVGALVDGQIAMGTGLRADVRSSGLDVRVYLTSSFAQSLSSASFTIAGGGALFQLTPEVEPNGQLHVGFGSVATSKLGNSVNGFLRTLRSGGGNNLASKNFLTAQTILVDAIDEISTYRGRLGSIQRNHIDTNINSQGVALENVTASESLIRDADMAVEVSALTRAQILVQSTQQTLQIANTIPNLVLSLLG